MKKDWKKRTYLVACDHLGHKGLCICWECAFKEAKKHYKLGVNDERRRNRKRD